MILRAIGRLVMVPLGLLLGALASVAVLVTLGQEWTTRVLHATPDVPDRIAVLFEMGFGIVGVMAAATIVPALLVVVVGEIARIRSLLYYVVGGGIAIAVLPLLARVGSVSGGGALPTRAWTVLATAGFAGGLVYWLVAGRRA